MNKFTSVEQFRNVIRFVKDTTHWNGKDENGEPMFDRTRKLPTILYRATVKIHGTNSGIVFTKDKTTFQSRNNEITPENDNAGFANYMQDKADNLRSHFDIKEDDEVCIYGEWAGKGIQKGVAVSEVDRFFAIFAVKINNVYQPMSKYSTLKDESVEIYNIMDFKTWLIDIDFENPHIAQDQIIKITEEVEGQCPVGMRFGVDGVGEGVVLTPVDDEWVNEPAAFWKSKGEKHSVSKVTTLAPVDFEKIENVKKFIEYAVTENRLNQGLEYLREQHLEPIDKNTPVFLRWVVGDVMKEEKGSIEESGLSEKELNKEIANVARKWYFQQLG